MKRTIHLEIQTSDDGQHCDHACSSFVPDVARCSAFDVPLRLENGMRYQPHGPHVRNPDCIAAEVDSCD